MKQLTAVLAGLVLFTGVVFAQGSTWKADMYHSNVKFTVKHMMISEVSGWFKDFAVTITQPKEGTDFTDAKVDVTIKTASINTNIEARDNHLKSADFFDVEKIPTMTFVSTAFKKTGDDTYDIEGNLTMHGVTKAVVLKAKLLGAIKGPKGLLVGFKATTSVNRYDYGLKWNKAIEAGGVIVSENVDIEISLEMAKN